jgi:ABC-type Fe3+-hydroxamate transport system substrate-binding protein
VITVRDDTGRTLTFAAPAQRIVSLVPSLTETLFALGCADAVIGITRYCTEPAGAVAAVARVGGTKNPDVAAIVALAPDLVVVNAEENRKEDFAALEGAGLTVFVSFSHRVRDIGGLMIGLGTLTGTTAAAARLRAELDGALGTPPPAIRRRVFCPIWKNPWMSFNADTYAHDVLAHAGGDNVCHDRAERYCTIDLEAVATLEPEVILLPDEPYGFSRKDLAALAPLDATPAGRSGRVYFVDGKALSWYGPRTASALGYFRAVLSEGRVPAADEHRRRLDAS